ncbi:hypothetical protein CPB83DRAFT_939649 [Crepidotus variabilis]|uniref:Glycoside hydrolase family 5 domain-containing protein n=1 Tax=Crepidotus variabilis TaxID=179855 RepID=A0A9P6EPN5_9AGAR|nr:hypothetical protein CPB83DRAFT_939649 [Crepidotus variabilis]
MPQIPHVSPLTSTPVHPSYIHTSHLSFIDNHGRTLLLRGVNLSGASKAPPGQLSHEHEDFWEQAERGDVSFVGRPLRLDDGSADTHLARLRGWGFNLLRVPFTWEALEHEGPGIYDYEYMDYLIQVLVKCREYGFRVYMDPHQDCWSRFSGGSGAPFWTLPACSLNPAGITATQSAILHSEYPSLHTPKPESLPAMIWSTNYGRLLSQTLFTLFFAGRDFAPECILDGMNIQDWLQSHFLRACSQLAQRIAGFEGGSLWEECIIGWDSLNEPFEGLIGWLDVSVNPTAQGSTLKKGTHPTPAQSMRLGMGQKQNVENWVFGGMGPRRDGWVEVDPKGWKVWASREELGEIELANGESRNERWGWIRGKEWTKGVGTCVWANHGVWDVESGFILRPDYFRYRPVRSDAPRQSESDVDVDLIQVEFLTDYYKPFYLSLTSHIRPSHPESIIFIQPPVFAPPPPFSATELRGRAAYSPHYYDGLTLVSRHWNWFNADALGMLRGRYEGVIGGKGRAVKVGEAAIRRSLREQIGYLADDVGVLGMEGTEGGDVDVDGETQREELEAEADERLAQSTASATYPGVLPGHLSLSAAIPSAAAGIAPSSTPHTSSSSPQSKPTTGIYPTLIGEIGTPFDMDSKRSYGWTDHGRYVGDYGRQEKALDASLNACDGGVGYLRGVGVGGCEGEGGACVGGGTGGGKGVEKRKEEKPKPTERPVNYTIWTYVPDDHSWEWGDGWNLEDLSLWSWGDWVDECVGEGGRSEEEEGKRLICPTAKLKVKKSENATTTLAKSTSKRASMKMPRRDSKKIVQEEEGLDSRAGLLVLGNDSFESQVSEDEDGEDCDELRGRSTTNAKTKQQERLRPVQMRIGMDGSELSLDTLGDDRDREVRTKRSSATMASTSTTSSVSSSSSSSSSSSPSHLLPTSPTSPTSPPITPTAKGYTPNPYTFLTNGARAVRAFARPWPTKVVGQAVDVRFELEKGVFWLGVDVRRGDWVEYPVGGRGGGGNNHPGGGGGGGGEDGGEEEDGDGDGDGEGEWDERKATEIFLPLVHYASRELVEDALSMWGRRRIGSSRTSSGSSSGSGSKSKSISNSNSNSLSSSTTENEMDSEVTETDSSTVVVDSEPDVDVEGEGVGNDEERSTRNRNRKQEREQKAKLLIRDTYTPLPHPQSQSSLFAHAHVHNENQGFAEAEADADHTTAPNDPNGPDATEPHSIPLIDVEVKISTGRYKINGQRLLWWYDVPSSSTSQAQAPSGSEPEPEPEPVRVELQVRRREGPLKALVDWRMLSGALAQSQSQSRSRGKCGEGDMDADADADAEAREEAREEVLMKEYTRVLGARPRPGSGSGSGHAVGGRWLAGHGWCERICGEDGVCVVM